MAELLNKAIQNDLGSGFCKNLIFKLKTSYSGLLVVSGHPHEAGVKGEFGFGSIFDYTTGLPVIPGSSVRGILRSYLENKWSVYDATTGKTVLPDGDKATILAIFEGILDGSPIPKYKRDLFFDAVPVATRNKNGRFIGEDTITPHKDPLMNPVPLPLIKVLPDVTYQFSFKLGDSGIKAEEKGKLFKEALLKFGAGEKTNLGYGQFTE